MPMIAVWLIDGQRLEQALQESRERLENADGEVVLDFASVHRLNPAAIRAMEGLATAAEANDRKLRLRSVSPEVYKVLKQVKLVSRFSFLS